MQIITIAEYVTGLTNNKITLQREAKRLEIVRQKRRLRDGRREGSKKRFKTEPLYASDSNEALRAFLKSKYPGRNIVDDSEMGLSDRGHNLLGVDGHLDLYVAGGQCQLFWAEPRRSR